MAKTKKLDLKNPKTARGFFLFVFALILALSLVSYQDSSCSKNWLGLVGHVIGWSSAYLFGLASFLIPLYAGWVGFKLFFNKDPSKLVVKTLYFFILLLSLSTLLAQLSHHLPKFAAFFANRVYSDYYPKELFYDPAKLRHYLGGSLMHHLYIDFKINFHRYLGALGTFLLSFSLLIYSFSLLTQLSFIQLLQKLASPKNRKKEETPKVEKSLPKNVPFQELLDPDLHLSRENPLKKIPQIRFTEKKPKAAEEEVFPEISLRDGPSKASSLTESLLSEIPKKIEVASTSYKLPSSSLLTDVQPFDQSSLKEGLRKQAEILEETLLSFGIEAKVGDIHCGPTITSFEVHPAVGVKVQKIKALENDIALNLQAKSIRIIAPIPGKAAVGIEVPNPLPQEVSFRDLLENYQASNKKAFIPLLLGKVVNGDDVWADLTKMPHLIIAGATGSGKSVCINTLVMSIIMNSHPDEIKILMIDPKKVELTAYTELPHMLAPVITEPDNACSALAWLVKEMERRYEIFRQLGSRNIHGFNSRKINKELEESLDLDIPDKMFFIVVIIDELADLMMVSSSDIETPIARIAQMARAVGIHMILATQRPSREVITGLIKANFPSRIAFKVSSRVNSQIIIDENGAESLLGNGDLLFLPPGSSTLVRAQGAFIRDEDINKVTDHIRKQSPTNYLIPSFEGYQLSGFGELKGDEPKDNLYEEARKTVIETGNASTTFLQRKLKIGYARAASLMDQLEINGIVGPADGAKPRKIFYQNSESE